MKIKRVDIVGFKSFVDKVSLDFQQRITGVVGPNGCGKSNIVDAIRWAMGEQNARNLRGRAMEDIIFGGSESRKPHNMAEVSIIFDNSVKLCPEAYRDYAEIMITRRLYRNGDSEYLINKTPCRLLDITELFMDTGVGARAYSIIEQGKVGMLVSARPEERRALIEEAAGVTKYKARKKTAQRKMDATRQNLVRLGDIISEVRRQAGSLKRQAQQAEKYRELRAEAKRIEICLTGNHFRTLGQELAVVNASLGSRSETLGGVEARLAEAELQLEEKQLRLLTVEEELNRRQEQDYALGGEIQRVEGDMTLADRQVEDLREQIHTMQEEQGQLVEQIEQLAAETQELARSEEQLGTDLEQTEETVVHQQELLQLRISAEQNLTEQLDAARHEQMELLSEAGRLSNRQEEIGRRLTGEEDRRQRHQHELMSLQQELSEVDRQLADLATTANLQAAEQASQQAERETRAEKILQLKAEQLSAEGELHENHQHLEKQRSRIESLEELERNLEGYTEGVKTLFSVEGGLVTEVVADLLQADPDYEALVEIALGERLQAVPVENADQAAVLHEELKSAGVRASLALPVRPPHMPGTAPGRPLVELVRPRAGQEDLIATLLAGCFLVDNVLTEIGKPLVPGTLLIDPAGRSLSWRGDMAGGTTAMAGAGLLRKKREIGELEGQVKTLNEALADQQDVVRRLQEEREEQEAALHQLDQELQQQALKKLEQQKDFDRLTHEQRRLRERIDLLGFEETQLREENQALLDERDQIVAKRQGLKEKQIQLQATSAQLQDQVTEAREAGEALREELTLLKVRLAEYRQQREAGISARRRLNESRTQQQQRQDQLVQRTRTNEARIETLGQEKKHAQIEHGLLLERREQGQNEMRKVREDYEAHRLALDKDRETIRVIREQAESLRREVGQQQLRHKELTVELGHLRESAAEKYDIDLEEYEVAEADAAELEHLQGQLKPLQQRIEALGKVNLTAIEEYRELEERYEFLVRQRNDLSQSLDDLQKAINTINRTTRRRFKETFELVNEKFQQVFPRLFRGGQAELRLTDEEDLLETGIDIIVQPPGKKLQNVNLLSGGEKALTAVAIIFSLFLIKPTPFCMLDEVDAPLDDANIDRFAEMVAEMSQNSQFIIITHSKRTMTKADTMHGITMQEPGVSKLVSVRMNDFTSDVAAAS